MPTKKATSAKKAVQAVTPVKKTAAKPAKVEATNQMDSTKGIRTSVLGVDGKAAGSITLPAEYFGQKPNRQLIAQATRVYLANQRVGNASTKTRGEVEGSTRKIYKQKGTGRARHGSIRAPIFVGGGIVFGPRPRDYSLKFPKSLKRVALASALSLQLSEGNVIIVSGLTDLKKTKEMARALTAVGRTKRTLLVVSGQASMVSRAGRNIEGIDIQPVSDMHAYGVMTHGKIVFMKEAVAALNK